MSAEGPHKDKHESVCVGHCHAFPADTADGTMKKKKSTMRIFLQPLAHKQDNHTFHALYHTQSLNMECVTADMFLKSIHLSTGLRLLFRLPFHILYMKLITVYLKSCYTYEDLPSYKGLPPSSFRKSPQHHLYFTVSVFLIRFRFTDCLLLESRVVFWEILLPHCWSECKTSQVL